ncbi:glycosyltransferase [Pedobacter jamesrossensis]|uniref:glycosyltransferase n=1 Tax=Pedobacter jamesrossensis TaxID=1908238 RepID=UPI00361A5CAE
MKISVLTPSYNSGKYIQRAIDSVLNQSYTNYEHIIADGGSTDDTIEIVKKHNKIIYVSEKDKGQSECDEQSF